MPNPSVTVIIPAYGRSDRTQRAIKSVTNQTHSPIELIIIDDGSDQPLSDNLDLPHGEVSNIDLIRHDKNKGANVARNTGIDNASGEFISFLDSDDEWHPEKIEKQVIALTESEAQAAYTSVKQVNADGKLNTVQQAIHSGDLRTELLKANVIGTYSSIMVDTDAIADVGTPNPDLPCWQDWEWYLRLSKSIKFTAIEDPLVCRHNEGDQISGKFPPKRDVAYPVVCDQLQKIAQTDKEEQVAMSKLNYHLGYSALINGEFSTARRIFLLSINQNKTNMGSWKYLLFSGHHYPLAQKAKRIVARGLLHSK